MEQYTCSYASRGRSSTYKQEPDVFRHRPPAYVRNMELAVEEVNNAYSDEEITEIAKTYGIREAYIRKVADKENSEFKQARKDATIIYQRLKELNIDNPKVIQASEIAAKSCALDVETLFVSYKRSSNQIMLGRVIFAGMLKHLKVKSYLAASLTGVSRPVMFQNQKKHVLMYKTDKAYKQVFNESLNLLNK
jgi:hypothetical protein